MKSKLVLLVLTFVFSTALFSQEIQRTNTKLSIVGHNLEKGLEAFYVGEERERIGVSYTLVKTPVKYRGDVNLGIYDKKEIEYDEEGKELPPMLRCKLPVGEDDVIIFIIGSKQKNGKTSHKAFAIPASLERFPAGSKYLLNLTNVEIRGQIAKKPFKLNDPKNVYFKMKAKPSNKAFTSTYIKPLNGKLREAFAVKMEYKKGEAWSTLKETRWFYTDKYRKLMLFFPSDDGKRIIMKNISHRDRTGDIPPGQSVENASGE